MPAHPGREAVPRFLVSGPGFFINLSRTYLYILTMVAAPSLIGPAGDQAVRADEPGANLSGTWKLVVMAFGDDEYAAIRIDRKDGKDRALVANSQTSVLGLADNLNVESLATEGGTISFT